MSELQEKLVRNKFVSNENTLKYRIMFLLSIAGPGFMAAVGDNDAGGIISYSLTGMKFGISFFIPVTICLVIITYTIQEMSMRLSTVTQTGFTSLIRKYYGSKWMIYNVVAISIQNVFMLCVQFIGMSSGLAVIGISMNTGIAVSFILVMSAMMFSKYSVRERMAVFIGLFNIIFIVIAIMTHPDINNMSAFLSCNKVEDNGSVFWYIAAAVGNAVAPWMIFFQGNALLKKGILKENIKFGRMDTGIGCAVQVLVAVCIIISGASLFNTLGNLENLAPVSIVNAFIEQKGRFIGTLFGLGLFNAGFLATITVSWSTSWCVSEAFQWKSDEFGKINIVFIVSISAGALLSLIPNLPMNQVALFVQVLGGIIMIPILVFLVILTNNGNLMGKYRNTLSQKLRSSAVAVVLISTMLLLILKSLL